MSDVSNEASFPAINYSAASGTFTKISFNVDGSLEMLHDKFKCALKLFTAARVNSNKGGAWKQVKRVKRQFILEDI